MEQVFESTYFCPGKIIITGQHSVVYGGKALAIALNQGILSTCRLQPLSVEKEKSFSVIFDKFKLCTSLEECIQRGLSTDWQVQSLAQSYEGKLKQLFELILSSIFKIDIFQSLQVEISLFNVSFSIESSIPIGGGMGSSAALALAISASFINCLRMKFMKQTTLFDITKKAHQIAQTTQLFIHKYPSGLDVAICFKGGSLTFQKNQAGVVTTQSIKLKYLPKFALINTRVSHSTKKILQEQKQKYKEKEEIKESILYKIKEISHKIIQILEHTQDYQQFCSLIRGNQKMLQEYGVCSEENYEISAFMNSIENISCKITGAGGGGCMIAFARSSVELSQALSLFKDTFKEKYEIIEETSLCSSGLSQKYL